MFSVALVAPRLWWHDIYTESEATESISTGFIVFNGNKASMFQSVRILASIWIHCWPMLLEIGFNSSVSHHSVQTSYSVGAPCSTGIVNSFVVEFTMFSNPISITSMSSTCTLHFKLVCGLLLERPDASINLTISKSDFSLNFACGISVASLICLLGVNPLPRGVLPLP